MQAAPTDNDESNYNDDDSVDDGHREKTKTMLRMLTRTTMAISKIMKVKRLL